LEISGDGLFLCIFLAGVGKIMKDSVWIAGLLAEASIRDLPNMKLIWLLPMVYESLYLDMRNSSVNLYRTSTVQNNRLTTVCVLWNNSYKILEMYYCFSFVRSIRCATAQTNLGRLSSRRWQSFPTAPDGTGLTCGQHIESHSCIFSFPSRTVTSLFK
jgi:hypothetical protein